MFESGDTLYGMPVAYVDWYIQRYLIQARGLYSVPAAARLSYQWAVDGFAWPAKVLSTATVT